MSSSAHFAIDAWADYVRNVGTHDRIARSRHLASGCRKCAELHDSLRAVREIAESDDRFEPPPSTLHVAKAIFNRPRPVGAITQMLETVTLLFDSQLSPAAAGIRNGL